MDGASRSLRCLALLALAACWGLGAPSAAQQPSGRLRAVPGGSGPIFSAPPTEACDTCAIDAAPFAPPGHEGFTPVGLDPPGGSGPWQTGPSPRPWLLRQFDLRHSSTHGRAMGPGQPLRGTSWLNRPYALSLDTGALLMGDRPAPNVRSANSFFTAVGLGWDWDHYWGSQVRIGWASPEMVNTLQTAANTNSNLFVGELSLLYYPWGDSRMRPYYRIGFGLTDIEYTNDLGRQQQANLLTIPIAVGMKYQLRRHLSWRLELADNIAFGQNETDSLNNFTLSLGLEWRFGGRPDGAWAWAPRGGAW